MSISSIENLPNEFFYEIFEYLNGREICEAFSNLNARFEELMNCSSISFKFNSYCSIFDKILKQFLFNHKHQITSFHIQKTDFFSSFSIDSSFDHLQSIVIGEIPSNFLVSLISSLSCLSHLVSLSIHIQYSFRDLTQIYRSIFTLPKLKYLECSANKDFTCISLPIANDEQFSPIERFILNHQCDFNTLCSLISYTPQICHLSLNDLSDSDSDNEMVLSVSFPNLKYLSIGMCGITFDDLEMFIKKSECNLKVLRVISCSESNDYIDGDRWEQLIVNYLPELKEFYLEYREDIDPESGSLSNFEAPNQFNSLFWNQRKWILEVEMDCLEYIYSIRSYEYKQKKLKLFRNHLSNSRKRWYDVDPPNKISNATRLKLTRLPNEDDHDYHVDDDDDDDDDYNVYDDDNDDDDDDNAYDDDKDYIKVLHLIIRDILSITQIYHLEICEKISSYTLLNIMHKFSALETLKISSLELSESCLKDKNLHLISKKNQIRKVYLEKVSRIEEVYFLVKLCPRIEYLKVGFMHNINIQLFIKDILKKIKDNSNQYLRSLCLYIPTGDDAIIEKLKEMINGEKLSDLTIKICN